MRIEEIIARNARRRPRQEALVATEMRLTHEELASRVMQTAGCLAALGVSEGDRVLVQMSNLIPYVELYFAVPLLGAILVPLNVRLTAGELPYYISHSQAICLIADEPRAQVLEQNLEDWGTIQKRVVVGGPLAGWESYEHLAPWPEFITSPHDQAAENEVAYIYYTSGTTGRPKGAMWTHRQVVEHLMNLQMDLPLTPQDASLIAVNLAHGPSTMPTLHQVLFAGGRVALYPGPKFEASEFAQMALDEKSTSTLLVPTMLSRMLSLQGEHKHWFENFKYIKYAAAKMPPAELLKAIHLMSTRLTQGYGSTETLGGVTFLAPQEHDPRSPDLEKRLASAGKEYCNVRVAIMDRDGNLLPPGEMGEIVVRSDKSFAGYWRDQKASSATFRQGWLLTGDLGRLDSEGYLYVVDRVSDMIITGGENVYPREVEDVLASMEGVAECAVLGVPDNDWGEAVWAFVVPRQGNNLQSEKCISFCSHRLASFKKPKRIELCTELPKNPMGKVQKHILREQALKVIQEGE